MIVALVGKGRNCPLPVSDVAHDCGVAIAEAGHVLITGGLGGCMYAAAQGAAGVGGQVIGLVPARREPDPAFPGLVLRTGMTEPNRNVLMGSACDAMVACDGSHGTLQELAVAVDRGVPIVQVQTQRWSWLEVPAIDVREVAAWLRSIESAGTS